jgi:hypothetical protein
VRAGTQSIPVPDSTAVGVVVVGVVVVGVVTVLPPGVVVVVIVPPVDVIVPFVAVVDGVVRVVAVRALPVVVVPVVLVVAAAPLGEMLAPHAGTVPGLVMMTSVTTSWRPAGTVNAVTPVVPASTGWAMDTTCSTAGVDVDVSDDGDAMPAEVVVAVVVLWAICAPAIAMVGVVCTPATPAPSTTSAAMRSLRMLRPIPGPPWVEVAGRDRKLHAVKARRVGLKGLHRRAGRHMAGRWCAQGRSRSNAADAFSTAASAKRRPTICNPTGSPVAVKPAGTEAAG